jgi:hypothetical protein
MLSVSIPGKATSSQGYGALTGQEGVMARVTSWWPLGLTIGVTSEHTTRLGVILFENGLE